MLGILEDDRQLNSSRVSGDLGGKFEFPQKARSHGLMHRDSMVVSTSFTVGLKEFTLLKRFIKFWSRTTSFNVQMFFFFFFFFFARHQRGTLVFLLPT